MKETRRPCSRSRPRSRPRRRPAKLKDKKGAPKPGTVDGPGKKKKKEKKEDEYGDRCHALLSEGSGQRERQEEVSLVGSGVGYDACETARGPPYPWGIASGKICLPFGAGCAVRRLVSLSIISRPYAFTPLPRDGAAARAGATRRPRARTRQIHAAGAGAGAAFAG